MPVVRLLLAATMSSLAMVSEMLLRICVHLHISDSSLRLLYDDLLFRCATPLRWVPFKKVPRYRISLFSCISDVDRAYMLTNSHPFSTQASATRSATLPSGTTTTVSLSLSLSHHSSLTVFLALCLCLSAFKLFFFFFSFSSFTLFLFLSSLKRFFLSLIIHFSMCLSPYLLFLPLYVSLSHIRLRSFDKAWAPLQSDSSCLSATTHDILFSRSPR